MAPLSQKSNGDKTETTATKPTLVFLHGFGGGSSAYEWSKVYPAFAGRYRVVAPDLLGWGRSHHPTRSLTLDDYLTSLTEFLAALEDAPLVVIASSLTAGMVVKLAIAQPQRFQALILVAPTGLSDFGVDYGDSLIARISQVAGINQLLYWVAIANPFSIRSFLEQRQFARASRVSDEMVEAYTQSAQQPHADYAALSFLQGQLSFDLADLIPQLTTPTALIWGRESQLTPMEMGDRLRLLNPTAIQSLTILDDVGLTPHLEVPAVTIGLLTQLLHTLT